MSRPGYNNGMKKRGGHSTKQDPDKVDTTGERVIEPRPVVSFFCLLMCVFALCGKRLVEIQNSSPDPIMVCKLVAIPILIGATCSTSFWLLA